MGPDVLPPSAPHDFRETVMQRVADQSGVMRKMGIIRLPTPDSSLRCSENSGRTHTGDWTIPFAEANPTVFIPYGTATGQWATENDGLSGV